MTDLKSYTEHYTDKDILSQNRERWDLYHNQLQRILDLQKDWPRLKQRFAKVQCYSILNTNGTIEGYLGAETSLSLDPFYTRYKIVIDPGVENIDPSLQIFLFLANDHMSLRRLTQKSLREAQRSGKRIGNSLESHPVRIPEDYGNFTALRCLQNLFIDSLVGNKTGEIYNIWKEVTGSEITPEEMDALIVQASSISEININ